MAQTDLAGNCRTADTDAFLKFILLPPDTLLMSQGLQKIVINNIYAGGSLTILPKQKQRRIAFMTHLPPFATLLT